MCVEHLASLGHREVVLVGEAAEVYRRGSGFANRSLAGFTRRAAELGLSASHHHCDGSPEQVEAPLDRPPRPPRVRRPQRARPAPAARRASIRGRDVPRDVSVVALAPDELGGASVTTVPLPSEEMGRRAVELLMAKLDGAPDSGATLLAPRARPARLDRAGRRRSGLSRPVELSRGLSRRAAPGRGRDGRRRGSRHPEGRSQRPFSPPTSRPRRGGPGGAGRRPGARRARRSARRRASRARRDEPARRTRTRAADEPALTTTSSRARPDGASAARTGRGAANRAGAQRDPVAAPPAVRASAPPTTITDGRAGAGPASRRRRDEPARGRAWTGTPARCASGRHPRRARRGGPRAARTDDSAPRLDARHRATAPGRADRPRRTDEPAPPPSGRGGPVVVGLTIRRAGLWSAPSFIEALRRSASTNARERA